jgi:hypothetical protein
VPTPTTLPPAPLLANGLPVPPLAARLPALSRTAATAADDEERGLAVMAALPLPMMAITPSSSTASLPTACRRRRKTFLSSSGLRRNKLERFPVFHTLFYWLHY